VWEAAGCLLRSGYPTKDPCMTTLVFVHGWSVTSTATYGAMPRRVQEAARAAGLSRTVHDIHLS